MEDRVIELERQQQRDIIDSMRVPEVTNPVLSNSAESRQPHTPINFNSSFFNDITDPLTAIGNEGSSWFNNATKHIWKKINNVWEDQGVLGSSGSTTNIGIISSHKTIDLVATSKDVLYGTLMGNSVITFSNPDDITNLNLELVIGTIITSLTIAGNIVDLTGLSTGDKLYLELKTTDTGNSWSLKKNDKRPASVIRNLNVYPGKTGDNFDQDQLTATWLPSLEGESVKYTAEISKTSNFVTILQSKSDIDGLSYSFLGLDSDTRYYIRIKGVNEFGESEWYPSPSYYSVRTQKVITNVTDVNLRETKTEKKIIISFDESTNPPNSDTPHYTLIRAYLDSKGVERAHRLFKNKLFVDITEKDRTDSLNLISKDKYNYFLIVWYNDQWEITYKLQDVIVPDKSAPQTDDETPGSKIFFRLSSGGSGLIAQILLESGSDGIYWERSLKPDIDSDGHFTYRPADGFVYRSTSESDDAEILKSIDFVANPGETYYIHYKLFNFPDNPNNYSVWSAIKSLTVAAVAKPQIGRLRATDESSTRIKLTIKSDNASTTNQQTLTIKRSTDGIDFTDIHTQLVSSTAEITHNDDTVLYPTNYHYQAILSSTGGADVSNTTQETPTAPPNPTAPTVSYSLTNQRERRGIEYAAVAVLITKTSPGTYAEEYEVLIEPRNSTDQTLTVGNVVNQGDTTNTTTQQYRDDVDSYVRISVRAKRKLDGVYSSYTSRQLISINA